MSIYTLDETTLRNLAEEIEAIPPRPHHSALLEIANHIRPGCTFRYALNRGGWYRPGGVIAADGTVTKPASQVKVDMLAIGGSNLSAFAGIGGGYTDGVLKTGATGLNFSNIEFGLALAGEQRTGLEATGYALRKWTTLQASAGSAAFAAGASPNPAR